MPRRRRGIASIKSKKGASRKARGIPHGKRQSRTAKTNHGRGGGNILQDLKHALRILRLNPGFTVVAIITLGLGIGANTAIFSIVNAVLLRPLPYPEPNRLVTVWGNFLKLNLERLPAKAAEYEDYASQTEIFDSVAAYEIQSLVLTGNDQPQRITAARATPNFLSLLQVQPMEGRAFTKDDGEQDRNDVVILSHSFRQRQFAIAEPVINKTVTLDDRQYTVIGVMPPGFDLPYSNLSPSEPTAADVFVPLTYPAEQITRRQGPYYLRVLARLKPTVTLAQAQAHMNALAQRLVAEQTGYRGPNGEDGGWHISVVPLNEELVGGSRRSLFVLLAAVGMVLLTACVNMANLLLLRATKRRKEFAVRTAVGANRRRLVQQLLIEGLLLVSLSGAFGLLLAYWGIDLLVALGSANLPRLSEIGIDGRVLAFTAITALISTLLLCLLPALQLTKLDLQAALKDAAYRDGRQAHRWPSSLIVLEVAVSLLLLIGAGLLANSFLRLQRVNPVVAVEQLMTGEINLSVAHYREPVQAAGFYDELIHRIEALPGVQAATFSTLQPLSGIGRNDPFAIEGRRLNPTELNSSGWQVVGPSYFRTLGIPLLKGRDITHSDSNPDSPVVAVINEKMATRYWPNESPIGQRLTLGLPRADNPWITIVGVAKDLPNRLDLPAEPSWFLSRAAAVQPNRFIFVRSTGNVTGLANGIRDAVQSIDRNQPITSLRSMSEVVGHTIAPRKFNTFLLSVFAMVALGLTALGTYSVISYSVALRTPEIAIRLALGAGKPHILKLVLKRGMKLALLGALFGLLAALALSRLMTSMLFEITATDPLTYALVSLFSLTIAFLACYIPAKKATQVDPLEALRFE